MHDTISPESSRDNENSVVETRKNGKNKQSDDRRCDKGIISDSQLLEQARKEAKFFCENIIGLYAISLDLSVIHRNPITTPVEINGRTTLAFVDTGADVSFLLAKKTALSTFPIDNNRKIRIQLADGDTFQYTAGGVMCKLTFIEESLGNESYLALIHRLDVVDLPVNSRQGFVLLLGRDLLYALQFNVTFSGEIYKDTVTKGNPESSKTLLSTRCATISQPDDSERHPEDGHIDIDEVQSELMTIARSEISLSKYDLLHPSCECVKKDSNRRQEDYTDRDMTTMEWRTVTGSPDYQVRERILEPGEVRDTPQQSKTFELQWLKGGETPDSNQQMEVRTSLEHLRVNSLNLFPYDFGQKLYGKH